MRLRFMRFGLTACSLYAVDLLVGAQEPFLRLRRTSQRPHPSAEPNRKGRAELNKARTQPSTIRGPRTTQEPVGTAAGG
jgi:hypothetical protein